MKGFVWLEKTVKEHQGEPLPIVKVFEDINNFSYTNPTSHPSSIKIARIVKEAFKLDVLDVRWFVMGDDDIMFAVDNLLQVLRKYDSSELYYIGNPLESHSSNAYLATKCTLLVVASPSIAHLQGPYQTYWMNVWSGILFSLEMI